MGTVKLSREPPQENRPGTVERPRKNRLRAAPKPLENRPAAVRQPQNPAHKKSLPVGGSHILMVVAEGFEPPALCL